MVKKLYQNQTDPLNQTHKRAKGKQNLSDSFDRFWAAYPKKRNKGDARKVWNKLKPKPKLLEQILSAVEQQSQSRDWLKEDGKYIPYPAKWLRGEQWQDEIGGNGELTHEATDEEIAALEREGVI